MKRWKRKKVSKDPLLVAELSGIICSMTDELRDLGSPNIASYQIDTSKLLRRIHSHLQN